MGKIEGEEGRDGGRRRGRPYGRRSGVGGLDPRNLDHPDRDLPLDQEKVYRTLFVRNLSRSVDVPALARLFGKYGAVARLTPRLGSRGICFVEFFDIRAACDARRALDEFVVEGRPMAVRFSLPRPEELGRGHNNGTLFVKLSPPRDPPAPDKPAPTSLALAAVPPEEFQRHFSRFGEVMSVRVSSRADDEMRFVEFFDVRAAADALRDLENTEFHGGRLHLEFSRPSKGLTFSEFELEFDLKPPPPPHLMSMRPGSPPPIGPPPPAHAPPHHSAYPQQHPYHQHQHQQHHQPPPPPPPHYQHQQHPPQYAPPPPHQYHQQQQQQPPPPPSYHQHQPTPQRDPAYPPQYQNPPPAAPAPGSAPPPQQQQQQQQQQHYPPQPPVHPSRAHLQERAPAPPSYASGAPPPPRAHAPNPDAPQQQPHGPPHNQPPPPYREYDYSRASGPGPAPKPYPPPVQQPPQQQQQQQQQQPLSQSAGYAPAQAPPQHAPPQHAPPQHAPPQQAPPQQAPPQQAPPQQAPPQQAPPQAAESSDAGNPSSLPEISPATMQSMTALAILLQQQREKKLERSGNSAWGPAASSGADQPRDPRS